MIDDMTEQKIIAIGSDHAGYEYKNILIDWLQERGYGVLDCGCYSSNSVDYPDIAEKVCQQINGGQAFCGVLICGTGIGISMAANKIRGIRAAHCTDCYSAKFTRLHNDANVICFGARVLGIGVVEELLEVFLATEFEGGRHTARIEKLDRLCDRN